MLGSIGSTELLLILIVALLVLGPKSLANMARSVGKVVGEFRRVSTDFQRTLNAEVALEEEKEKREKAQKDVEADLQKAPASVTANAPAAAAGTATSAAPADGDIAAAVAAGDNAPTAPAPKDVAAKPADDEDDDFSPPAGSPLDEALKKAAAEAQAAEDASAQGQTPPRQEAQPKA